MIKLKRVIYCLIISIIIIYTGISIFLFVRPKFTRDKTYIKAPIVHPGFIGRWNYFEMLTNSSGNTVMIEGALVITDIQGTLVVPLSFPNASDYLFSGVLAKMVAKETLQQALKNGVLIVDFKLDSRIHTNQQPLVVFVSKDFIDGEINATYENIMDTTTIKVESNSNILRFTK